MNRPIRCCRCRHVHTEADRVSMQQRGQPRGSTVEVCPRCEAHSYHMLRADGQIAKNESEWAKGPEPTASIEPEIVFMPAATAGQQLAGAWES